MRPGASCAVSRARPAITQCGSSGPDAGRRGARKPCAQRTVPGITMDAGEHRDQTDLIRLGDQAETRLTADCLPRRSVSTS
jgi:hypothetical protein